MISHVIYIGIILFQSLCCFAYKYRSEHDMLTGLYNREWLFGQNKSHKNKLIRLMEKTKKSGKSFGALFIDLDGFKKINDKQGHIGGDLTLIRVSTILKIIARHHPGTNVIRNGGDEILVIYDGTGVPDLRNIACEILEAIGRQTQLTASIGGAIFSHCDEVNQEKFMNIIDEAMYSVKNNGKNGINIV